MVKFFWTVVGAHLFLWRAMEVVLFQNSVLTLSVYLLSVDNFQMQNGCTSLHVKLLHIIHENGCTVYSTCTKFPITRRCSRLVCPVWEFPGLHKGLPGYRQGRSERSPTWGWHLSCCRTHPSSFNVTDPGISSRILLW